ncbi:hypothetical protein HK101_004962, partial [Irineochytrium annulatum]
VASPLPLKWVFLADFSTLNLDFRDCLIEQDKFEMEFRNANCSNITIQLPESVE